MSEKNTATEYLQAAEQLARKAGQMAFKALGNVKISTKPDGSAVTEADVQIQDFIVRKLMARFPSHGILAEENTPLTKRHAEKQAAFVWVIDPIDGTRNFVRGARLFSCSIGLLHRGRPVVGAIYEPNLDWLFSATSIGPARFNGRPVQIPNKRFGSESVVGISINTHSARPKMLHELLNRCMVRNLGSTALHLGMTAAGMFDAAVHFGGKLWDIAAGVLIVQRAGGSIVRLDAKGRSTGQNLWPMNLTTYHNESIPLLTGGRRMVKNITTGS